MKVFGYVLIAFGCYLFMMNWQNVERQDRIIRGAVPTKVVILDKRVKKVETGSSTSYSPSIVYAYTLGKSVYHSDRTLPIEQTRSDEHWADSMLSGYTIGKSYTGYYDPAEYQKSFLVRRYTIAFYLPLFISLVFFVLAAVALVGPFGKASPILKANSDGSGLYEIEPAENIRAKVLVVQVCTGVWWFGSFLILGSYASVAQPHLSIWFWISSAVAVALGSYPTASLFKIYQAATSISNVVVLTDVSQVILGQAHKLKIVINAAKECAIRTLKVTILCRQVLRDSDGSQTSTLYEKHILETANGAIIRPGQPLTFDETLCAPAAHPKTKDESGSAITWDILIKLSTADGGAIDQRYPFIVYSASDVAKK